LTDCAVHADEPAHLLHQRLHLRNAEARSAFALRREIGIKDPVDDFRGHPHAMIADANADIVARIA